MPANVVLTIQFAVDCVIGGKHSKVNLGMRCNKMRGIAVISNNILLIANSALSVSTINAVEFVLICFGKEKPKPVNL